MRTKKPNFDIRRSVKLKKAVTGAEIAEALKKVATTLRSQYVEVETGDINGEKSAILGLSSHSRDADVLIRTGKDLDETRIYFNREYTAIGVGSVHWTGVKFKFDTYESGYIRNVELVKKELEEIL